MSKETIFHKAPAFIQNLMVSLYNILEYRKRYGKNYFKYKSIFNKNNDLSIEDLQVIQKEKYTDFNPNDIDSLYAEKEALQETLDLLKENDKETLAQVFTDNRYTKKDNEFFSEKFLEVIRKQGFLNQ